MWQPTEDEILELIAINSEKATAKRIAHYATLAPILFDEGCAWANNEFDMTDTGDRIKQSAMKKFVAKAAQYAELKIGLSSRRMGSVSYSFLADDMPKSYYAPLKPYRKLRWE